MTESFVELDYYGDPAGWDANMSEIWADGYGDCRTDILHNTVTHNPYDGSEDEDSAFGIWEAGYTACHSDSLDGTETPNPYEED